MLTVNINGRQEVYRNTDELLYYLKSDYNVDLTNLGLLRLEDSKDKLCNVVENVDCIGCNDEIELLNNLKNEIESLRLHKEKKDKLLELVEDIKEGLADHVEYYQSEAMGCLNKINW